MRKILYFVLAAVILLVWGTTTFGSTNSEGQTVVGNVLHHTSTLKIDREADPDFLANFNPSTDFKEACLWVVGGAATFLFICPLAAWQMTIQPVNRKKRVSTRH